MKKDVADFSASNEKTNKSESSFFFVLLFESNERKMKMKKKKKKKGVSMHGPMEPPFPLCLRFEDSRIQLSLESDRCGEPPRRNCLRLPFPR